MSGINYLIQCKSNRDLYWNDGWGGEHSATRFTQKKMLSGNIELPGDAQFTPEFRTKSGLLTHYAFDCGYIEEVDGEKFGVRLWQDGCYHVRRHWITANTGRAGYLRESWHTFSTLSDARIAFRKEVRAIQNTVTDEQVAAYINSLTEPTD